MTECYYAYDDDFYNSINCDLSEGHDGPHRASYEWETRPADICREKGHVWGEWSPVSPRGPLDISWFLGAEPIKKPTLQRICTRCDRYEDNGKYAPTPIFPRLQPLTNKVERKPA